MISSLIGTYPCSVTFLLVLLFEFAFMLHLSLVQCLPQINLTILEHFLSCYSMLITYLLYTSDYVWDFHLHHLL